MDNQHQKITGYRDLTPAEIDLINKIKAQGAQLQALVEEVQASLKDTHLPHEISQAFAPGRWAAIAATDFQTGLMALTRAVARPSSF
jgi:hypothetical protein